MTLLRIVLLALAVVAFAAIGWRLSLPLEGGSRPAVVAVNRPPVAPVVPAPQPAAVAPPVAPAVVPPATPPAPALPAAPQPVAPPAPPPAPVEPKAPPTPPAEAPGAATVPPPTPPPAALTAADARVAVEARLLDAPDLAHVFDVLRAEFPAVADRSLAVATAMLREKGQPPSPDDFIAAALRELRLSAGVLAAHAGPDTLSAIFDAKAATLADLEAADPRICADYLYGSTSPEFSDFVVGHRALVARSAIATIAAMADGRTRQANWDVPSADDYQLIEKGLTAKGLSAAEIAALLDGKSLDPPPSDTRLCDNMRAYLDVMRAMPPDARNRVYAFAADLLARS